MKKLIISVLCSVGLTIGLVGSANAISGVPYWSFTQDYSEQMYFFVNIGPGQIAYYIGDNHAIATMIDNAGHAGASIDVSTNAGSFITMVGGAY